MNTLPQLDTSSLTRPAALRYDHKYLNLLLRIAITQFKVKDQSAVFGFLWSFLHPLIMLSILFVLFYRTSGRDIDHFALYILIGVVQYTHFSNTTSRSMVVLHSMKRLTCDTIFPKELLVLGSVLADAIDLVVSLLICVVIATLAGLTLSWSLIALLFVCLLQLLVTSSVALILACTYVFIRDLGHVYQAFLRLLMFVTPIFYASAVLNRGLGKYILLLNPLAHLIGFSRSVVLEGRLFSVGDSLVLLAVASMSLYLSLRIFRFYERRFSENV